MALMALKSRGNYAQGTLAILGLRECIELFPAPASVTGGQPTYDHLKQEQDDSEGQGM